MRNPRTASAICTLALCACGRVGFDARDGGSSADDAGDGGPIAPFVPYWQSGSRIRARILTATEGGDPQFFGWHDTMLDTDCQSALAADGEERCMPDTIHIGTYWSDAACTQPLALSFPPACGEDHYAYQADLGNHLHEFPLGTSYAGAVWNTDGGPCTSGGVDPQATLYTIGAEVPATTFIHSQYMNLPDAAARLHVWGGFTDGARVDLGILYDPISGASCEPLFGRLGAAPCRDLAPAIGHPVFLDAACTQRAYLFQSGGSPGFLRVDAPSLCGPAYSYVRVTATALSQGDYYVSSPGTCAMQAMTGSDQLFFATPSPDPFPAGTTAPGPHRGRLGALVWSTGDGTSMPVFAFDQTLGLPCRPFRATDGVLRCLPDQPTHHAADPDASCNSAAQDLVGACFGPPPLDGPNFASCIDSGQPVRAYTTSVPGASQPIENACVVLDAPGAYAGSALGPELPPAMFPQLVETVE